MEKETKFNEDILLMIYFQLNYHKQVSLVSKYLLLR